MTDLQNRIVGIVGRKGSGKSTRVATLLKYAPRLIVWDPMNEHHKLIPNNISDDINDLWEFLNEASGHKTFACTYTPGEHLEAEFEQTCRAVSEFGNVLLCVEEAPLVCTASYIPPVFGKVARTGRHNLIDVLWTAQRASEVSRTGATDVWIFFSQTEPRDLDAIADRCGRDIATRVANLGLHDFFTWDAILQKAIENSPRLLKRDVGASIDGNSKS